MKINERFLVYPIGEVRPSDKGAPAYYIGMENSPHYSRILFQDGQRCFAIMCPPGQNYQHPSFEYIYFIRDTDWISNKFIRRFIENYISNDIFRKNDFEWPRPAEERTPNPYGYNYEGDHYEGAADAMDVAGAYRAYREGTGSLADVRAALRAARGHGRRS